MAISEGLKGFFKMLTDGFTSGEDVGDEPFTDLLDRDSDYVTDGNVALDPKSDDIDKIYSPYATKVSSKSDRHYRDKVSTLPSSYKSSEVTVIEPRSFSESAQIVRKLIDKKTVILHLDLLDKEQSQRTIDFVCGAAHALNGTAQKISDAVFIFTPNNVSLSVENNTIQNKFTESLWNKPL